MDELEDSEKKKLLSKAELSVWLDNYDDVFSDFDSRPYDDRTLSDDFLGEVRKMVREKPTGNIELKLLIPENMRQKDTEIIIIKNLHSHFRHFAQSLQQEIKQTVRRGYLLSIFGFLLMIATAYADNILSKGFYLNIFRTVTEPAGWFMVWSGLENIFSQAKTRNTALNFNSRMARAEITFLSY